MAIGIYGSKKMADITSNDVDILYAYSPDRESIGDVVFQPMYNSVTDADLLKMLGADGMYKLRLPADKFNKLGFYSIVIKPKTIQLTIIDCSYVVSSDDNTIKLSKKGLVIPSALFASNSIVGYQVEYIDSNGNKIPNLHRIITSADLVSPASNSSVINQGATSYQLDSNGQNLFLTLTPDEPSLINSSGAVNIGAKGQTILVSNTYLNPTCLEIEMSDTTLQTLAIGIFGNSTRDLGSSTLNFYDSQNRIYKSFNLYTAKLSNGVASTDIREQKTIIDPNITFAQVTQGLST